MGHDNREKPSPRKSRSPKTNVDHTITYIMMGIKPGEISHDKMTQNTCKPGLCYIDGMVTIGADPGAEKKDYRSKKNRQEE